MTLELKARVNAMRYESRTVLSVELAPLERAARFPPCDPGAHIDIEFRGDLRRSYSLLDAADTDRYRIAIHRDPNSRGGSVFVHDALRVGDIVSISRPKNNFPLDENAQHSILIAGGIGVTPILCMARRLIALNAPFRLHYASRSRAAAAFLDEITAIERSRASIGLHFDDEAGAFLDIAAIVGAAPAGAHFYCCGPEPMLAAFKQATSHLSAAVVHFEHFSATEEAAREGDFEVVLARQKISLSVPPGKTILEVLLDAKINVPFSCSDGVCGTCETRVIEGVPDHRDSFLTEAEKASNQTIMVCCSGAKTPKLVLDL